MSVSDSRSRCAIVGNTNPVRRYSSRSASPHSFLAKSSRRDQRRSSFALAIPSGISGYQDLSDASQRQLRDSISAVADVPPELLAPLPAAPQRAFLWVREFATGQPLVKILIVVKSN